MQLGLYIYLLGVFRFLERNSLQPSLMSSDWLTKFTYRSVPEYLIHKGRLLLSVTDYKVRSFPQRFWPLRRQGSLSCHTCCDTGLRFTRSHPKDRPLKSYNILQTWGVIMTYLNFTDPNTVPGELNICNMLRYYRVFNTLLVYKDENRNKWFHFLATCMVSVISLSPPPLPLSLSLSLFPSPPLSFLFLSFFFYIFIYFF